MQESTSHGAGNGAHGGVPEEGASRATKACFHGGAFFAAIGEEFDRLGEKDRIINADVLDAWFSPSPRVVAALQEHLPWLLKTSPPTGCEGMIRTIARVRGVEPENVLPGSGSSTLIFLALREWLTAASRVLLLDPTYGEYAHVLEEVIGCRVTRLPLPREDGYRLDPAHLSEALSQGYDLAVLVNPNSPTGAHVPRSVLEAVLAAAPAHTRIWIDETYVEYAGEGQSLERFAAASRNVMVCKSMSKVYALSGARAAYLCGPAEVLRALRRYTPPWAVSLIGQVAAVEALQDPGYYAARYAETRMLREALAAELERLGLSVVPGVANFILGHLPAGGPNAAAVVEECHAHGLFLRDTGGMGAQMGTHTLRTAVKDAETNRKIVEILECVLTRAGR